MKMEWVYVQINSIENNSVKFGILLMLQENARLRYRETETTINIPQSSINQIN